MNRHCARLALGAGVALALALPGAAAWAQRGALGLPGLPELPTLPPLLPAVPLPRDLPAATAASAPSLQAPQTLQTLRHDTIDRLLRAEPQRLQPDPAGEPVVRGELLALPSSAALREVWRSAGYTVLRELVLGGLGDERWTVLRPPADTPLAQALARLRQADPAGSYDYHHVYTTGGAAVPTPGAADAPRPSLPTLPTSTGGMTPRIGLIDSGVDDRHPTLRAAELHRLACPDAQTHPAGHGTAVASLLVGQAVDGRFRGALPGAALWAADAYCGAPTGGSVQAVAQALAWLVRERVPVINLSLVGPANALLARAVAATLARGHLIVAAAGNDGPAAPPLYPAAWPGVVAVSAMDSRRRLLPEAARGPHVAFTAPGADLVAAAAGSEAYDSVRGTSFAAPLVAGLLASHLRQWPADLAAQAVAGLARTAVDLGPPGRDDAYGWGLVGEALRVAPTAVPLTAPQ